mgnify:CR=1 FL=1
MINLAVRTEMFTGRPGNPAAIVMDASWLTMAMANLCVIIIGACILYHIEHVNNGIQKMDALPVNPAVLFLIKESCWPHPGGGICHRDGRAVFLYVEMAWRREADPCVAV